MEKHNQTSQSQLGFQILELPVHILYDILAKLPVWSIFCCRCVCKTFRELITDKYFENLYISRAPTSFVVVAESFFTKPHIFWIDCFSQPPCLNPASSSASRFAAVGDPSSSETFRSGIDQIGYHNDGIKDKFTKWYIRLKGNLKLVNSCNGFLCLHQYSDKKMCRLYCLCNPILGEFVMLPPPPISSHKYLGFSAFGYDPKSKKYKILQLVQKLDKVVGELYTLGERSWRVIEEIAASAKPKANSSFHPSVNGALHWVTDSSKSSELIYSFDLHTDEFKPVAPPSHLDVKKISWSSVGVLEGCLCLCYVSEGALFEAWLMKEYGTKKSWTRKFTIDINSYCGLKIEDKHRPIGFTSDGDMWLKCESDSCFMVSYSPKSAAFKVIDTGAIPRFNATPHVLSFVSLKEIVDFRTTGLKLEINKPESIRRHFERQGIRSHAYRPICGNMDEIRRMYAEVQSKPIPLSHDIIERVCPFYRRWSAMYGKTFLYWMGSKPRIITSDPDIIKDVLLNKDGSFEKVDPNPLTKLFYGKGILFAKGEQWATHRRIANQAFKIERIKSWIPEIVESTLVMLGKWEEVEGRDRNEFEIDVYSSLHDLAADIISVTSFGSSFQEGKRIFSLLEQQCHLASQANRSFYIPGSRFLPTKNNRERKRLQKETCESIRVLIEDSNKSQKSLGNLLSLLMSSHKSPSNTEERLGSDEIIDNCRNFYFAGKETTANSMCWALLLLGLNQEWQTKAREEVIRVIGNSSNPPTAETLNDLKLVNLIIQETLRLYPLTTALVRQASKRTKVGNIDIPAGTQFYLSQISVHHDTKIWGEDALEFNPIRFTEPRKLQASFFPFGLGPNFCVGQNLAMVEMRVVLAMILQRYAFVVSPTYAHAPMLLMSLRPQYGLQLEFRRLSK
ncbi:hypothetical protein L6164_036117 [Bauhinia variegata]|uniref:Uncharacterized protein n=1 Tax=Bauhinia variegata TaxID=167791 RepID=A0ACB9KG51_BAUVA|nr:hypothetical protein L6164_036117 [Bauhinia variegata]